MRKKTKNRLIGVMVLALSLFALAFFAGPLAKEQQKQQALAKEEQKMKEFFAWRDK